MIAPKKEKDLYDILKVIENYFEWDQDDILENYFDLFDENEFDSLMMGARVLGREARSYFTFNVGTESTYRKYGLSRHEKTLQI